MQSNLLDSTLLNKLGFSEGAQTPKIPWMTSSGGLLICAMHDFELDALVLWQAVLSSLVLPLAKLFFFYFYESQYSKSSFG